MTKYACALIACLLLASTSAVAGEAMTGQDIIRLTPGTFHAIVKGKYELMVTLTRDGVAIGRAQGLEDRGRWTVRGDELCIVMPAWTRGKVECSNVVVEGGWYRGRSVSFQKL